MLVILNQEGYRWVKIREKESNQPEKLRRKASNRGSQLALLPFLAAPRSFCPAEAARKQALGLV